MNTTRAAKTQRVTRKMQKWVDSVSIIFLYLASYYSSSIIIAKIYRKVI